MQRILTLRGRRLRPLVGGAMAFLLLALSLLASAPDIHRLLHSGAVPDEAGCAVCIMAQGQLDAPVEVAAPLPVPIRLLESVPVTRSIASQSLNHAVVPGQGPPAAIVVLA